MDDKTTEGNCAEGLAATDAKRGHAEQLSASEHGGQTDAAPSPLAVATYDNLDFGGAGPAKMGRSSEVEDRSAGAPRPTEYRGPICASCQTAIARDYFTLNQRVLCPPCRGTVEADLLRAGGGFAKAVALASLAAVAGALVYYAIVALTGYELGLIAIVVGYGVGKAVRMGAGIRRHWIYRGLALALTWLSIVTTYVPSILQAMEAEPSLVSLLVAGGFAVFAPLVMLVEGEFMAVIILGIGLWEAWRYSAPPVLEFEGPFQLGAKSDAPLELSPAT